MSNLQQDILTILEQHENYVWWPATREFVCKCEVSLGQSYPDPAHRQHVAEVLYARLKKVS